MLLRERDKDEQAEAVMRGELTWLNLEECSIFDDGAEIVASFLKKDKFASKVCLAVCLIESQGAEALAEALKHNETVESLDIGGNQIGYCAEAFIEALQNNACITNIDFDYCGLASESIRTIKYLTETRNKILIPAAVRRASLYLIAARRRTNSDAGALACFPKEIVKMIAMKVWTTRKDPIWIQALSESEQTGV